jgi:hypothetical protein
MFHFDPRLTAVFSVLFIALGVFNLVLGYRRMVRLQASGQVVAWYKQMGILTGIEYVLLGLVLLLNLGISSGVFPGSLAGIIVPLYTTVLILAAIVLAAMLLVSLRDAQRRRSVMQRPATTVSIPTEQAEQPAKAERDSAEQAEYAQRRRERRQKAAAARRRQSGRA